MKQPAARPDSTVAAACGWTRLRIHADSTLRVEDGVLGTWDATGLSGLYAVELQVIRTDQRIDTAIMQLSVQGK